ncbi:MAG: hypothetical protein K1X92_08460 [Bacteroidia bacterium]|nr:hypothetical protein [Bacteroidia bacterium]
MGYGIHVNCNCYKEGRTTEPPHKSYIKFDAEDFYLEIPNEIRMKDKEQAYQMDEEFEEWKRTACEHEDMKLINEHLCNLSGMGELHYVVNGIGEGKLLPILKEHLPTSNDGFIPVHLAQALLEELILLEKELEKANRITLIEKSSRDSIAFLEFEPQYFFLFTENNQHVYGIDEGGFCIFEKGEEENKMVYDVVFHSSDFIQKRVSDNLYKFIDNSGGASYECSEKLYPQGEEEAGEEYEFEIIIQEGFWDIYLEYRIGILKEAAKASMISGNPIYWS